MTPEELDRAQSRVINDMAGQVNGNIMGTIGLEALEMIKKRVIKTGTDAEGQKYKPYSTKKMLANRAGMNVSAYNKIASSKAKRKELKWVTIDSHKLFEIPGGYKQFRELHGKQTAFVDFSFSNDMWNNITLISKASDHNNGTAIIGTKDKIQNAKLEGNTKRRGDILDLSNKEQDELKEDFNLGVLRIFKNNGL